MAASTHTSTYSLPCVVYLTLLLTFKHRRQSSWRVLPILFLALAAFYGVLSPFIAGTFTTISSNAFFRTMLLSPFKWGSSYRGPREHVPIQNSHPQNNIILIVDESVRGDHLSVNGYGRETTPYLQYLQQQGWLQTWGIAASGATCSKAASDLLLVGMGPTDLPNNDNQIWKHPSIFQYAKAMGYRTYFIDGQSKTSWLGTSFDKNYIDNWMTPGNFQVDPNDRDAAIGKRIAEIVGGSVGNFIWLSKRGIHYPYAKNFPTSEAWWQPGMDPGQSQIDPARREELINSYDNALRFNLETFFRAVDPTRWDNNVFAIYTSDHGQTLSEHGERHTHCGMAMDTASSEAAVPLLIITKAPITVDTKFLASHVNIFTTLLDLIKFPKSERPYEYALSLLEARAYQSQTRYFSVGSSQRSFFNRRVLFHH